MEEASAYPSCSQPLANSISRFSLYRSRVRFNSRAERPWTIAADILRPLSFLLSSTPRPFPLPPLLFFFTLFL